MDVETLRPIPATRNSEPYNCLEVYEKCKRDELEHTGDFKYLLDYAKKILKWHHCTISRPEVSRYNDVPFLELPSYLVQYYELSEGVMDKNYQIREAQKSIRLQYLSTKPTKRTEQYFNERDANFKYEKNVTNLRQKLAKKVKRVTTEEEVKSIEDNQYLLYHRAMQIWSYIQKQAQLAGDVRITSTPTADPLEMFPITGFSEILVDTPPLPVRAKYDRLVRDVDAFKEILRERGKHEEIERSDADMIVPPSIRHSLFGDPPKWRPIGRIIQNSQLYP